MATADRRRFFGDLLIINCDGNDEAFVVAAGQADRRGPLEDAAAAAGGTGVLDAAGD